MLECSGHLWSVKDVRWLTMDVGAEVCEPQQVWGDAHYWLMENFASKCQLDLSIWTVGQIKNHWWKKQRHYFADQGPCNQSYGFSSSHVRIREVNGTPLQYSCLENPMDGGVCRLQSMGSWRVGHDWSDLAAAAAVNWRNTLLLLSGSFKCIFAGSFFHDFLRSLLVL